MSEIELEGPAYEGDGEQGALEPGADPGAGGLAGLRKAVATLAAAAIGVGIAIGVDVSEPVMLLGATILTVTPIVVYAVRNGTVDAPSANKAVVALGAGVVGVATFLGVDVSESVDRVVGVLVALTPLLVYLRSNE